MPAATMLSEIRESTVKRVYSRPITFDEFLDMFGKTDYVELVEGVIVEQPMVQLDHDLLERWISTVLHLYVRARGLGIILGSRSPVRITEFGGRMPDIFYVNHERMSIVQQKATFGPPDLIIEVVSPNDSKAHLIELETDYRTVGAGEIVFIDQHRRTVRVVRKRGDDYIEDTITQGALILEALDGIRLELDWLFSDPRPDERQIADSLIGS